MKLSTYLAIIGCAVLLLVACTEQNPVTTGRVKQTESQSSPQVARSPVPAEVDGTLTQTEKGLAIVTDTGTYILAGQDLTDMLGKKVKITGAIAEASAGRVIRVMSVVPLQ